MKKRKTTTKTRAVTASESSLLWKTRSLRWFGAGVATSIVSTMFIHRGMSCRSEVQYNSSLLQLCSIIHSSHVEATCSLPCISINNASKQLFEGMQKWLVQSAYFISVKTVFWHADQMSFQKHCADELCSSTLMATWPCRQHLQELSSLPSRQHCSLLCGEHFSKRYAPRVDTLQPSNLRKCRSFMPLVVCTSALWSCTTAFQQSAHATIDRCALSYCQPEHLE